MNEQAGSSVSRWRIDRHIPVAVILAIIMQTTAMVWWASSLTARVEALERNTTDNRALPERVSRIEGYMSSINDTLSRIERKIEP